MLGVVPVRPKSLDSYRTVVSEESLDELRHLAAPLRGARVLHLNVTAFGTGVAETLSAMVPLLNDLGLESQWQVLRSGSDFVSVTKAMYRALGGSPVSWSPRMTEVWLQYNAMNASLLELQPDFVVVHDPQPVALLSCAGERGKASGSRWLWHCHLDLAEAQPEVWEVVRPHLAAYDGVIVDSREYHLPPLSVPVLGVVPPAIDPLGPRNMDLTPQTIESVLRHCGLDIRRPMVCQQSAMNSWNDPLGLIEAYHLAKEAAPGLQLLLIATAAAHDEATQAYHLRVARESAGSPDIHLLSLSHRLGNVEINAFQQAASLVVHRSIHRGFSLSLLEAQWKAKPVLAGRAGALPHQLRDGVSGYVIRDNRELGQKMALLLGDPHTAAAMGTQGREYVREHYLITRTLKECLQLFASLAR